MIAGLVSTVIPVFERPAALREAVESVLAQTYRPIEIVIVDDGSGDGTPAVAEALSREHPEEVRWVRRENGGPGAARETGRGLARGEFLQYLDSDDVLLPRKFELQVRALRNRPEALLAYGVTLEREVGGILRQPPVRPSDRPIGSIFPTFLTLRFWNTASPLYRSASCAAVGPWLPLRQEEDWEYDCRLGTLGRPVEFVSEVVAEWRASRSGSLSSRPHSPEILKDRTLAHEKIYGHARVAGVAVGSAEMARFSRELFLLSRQCGALGLAGHSRRLFHLARESAGPIRAAGLDFRFYRALAGLLGWRLVGRVAIASDWFR